MSKHKNGMYFLIIDDDVDFAESIAIALEAYGHSSDIYHSAEEAIENYRPNFYDMVFMDVKLPGMNGIECFLKLKERETDIKVVIMTGYSMEHDLETAIENDVHAIYSKPFDIREVLEKLPNPTETVLLLADDDKDFVEIMKDLLDSKVDVIKTASNGAEALSICHQSKVDLLILDICMPIMDGLQAFIELRKSGMNIPTIIITAYGEKKYAGLTKSKDTFVLQKPLDPKELISIVKKVRDERNQ